MYIIDKEIKNFLNAHFEEKETPEPSEHETINLFYKNQMTNNYLQREKQLKNIIRQNISGKNDNKVVLYI